MGLFSSKTPKAKGSISFVEKVDALYVKAFQTQRLDDLQKYLTPKCLTQIGERIRMSNKDVVGIERYKKTNWSRMNDTTYVKHVTFEDVNMGCAIHIPMGDPYDEYWTIISTDGDQKIDEIRRVAC